MKEDRALLTVEYVSLAFVTFCAFCQISLFYGLIAYLERIGIPMAWRGAIVSLEPMTAFVLRPFVAPFIHAGNALRVLYGALGLVILVLLAYPLATSVAALAAVRVVHGLAFLLLVSATMTLFVLFIPRTRSAAGFGYIGVATQLPYAIMPAVAESLLRRLGDEAHVYAAMSTLGVAAVVLLAAVTPRLTRALARLELGMTERATWQDIRTDLGRTDVGRLLATNLLMFVASTTVFFFSKGWLAGAGGGRIEVFFTVYILAGLAVRVVAGGLFDRFPKDRALRVGMMALSAVFLALPAMPAAAYVLAVVYGATIAVVYALLNGLMLDVSEPRFRGLNANLMLVSMDAGFFAAPMLGSALLGAGFGYTGLFLMCAALSVGGAVTLPSGRQSRTAG